MSPSNHQEDLRFRALAEAALAAVGGLAIETAAQKGLEAAVAYVGLSAGALLLWDEQGAVKARAVIAPAEGDRQLLMETESNLLSMLRQSFQLQSAYMEIGGEPKRSVFTLPLICSGRSFGALVGIRLGSANLFEYDHFLRALAAVLSLAARPETTGAGVSQKEMETKVKEEREAAIVEIAVAVNHEINNPLTALMGHLQLLMLKNKNLPEEIQGRLKIIEESANQIREVTGRLMHAADAPSVDYTGGMKMVDLMGRSQKAKDESAGGGPEGEKQS